MDIRRMLADLQTERNRIDQAINALQSLEGGAGSTGVVRRGRRPGRPPKSASAGASVSSNGRRRRRTMSPAARKRISEMMKQRWAERKKRSAK
jgi:hypothetical protein